MKAFSALLDGLTLQPSREGKAALLKQYFGAAADPDRGYAVAILSGSLKPARVKPKLLQQLALERVDPVLFDLSHDFVRDLAETVALIWPGEEAAPQRETVTLSEVVTGLGNAGASEVPGLIGRWLDNMDATQRWALLKIITGGSRAGVSPGLAKTALAEFGMVPVPEVAEIWHGLEPPYSGLFAWLEGRGDAPDVSGKAVFRPPMRANRVSEAELAALDATRYRGEWYWDGMGVQLVALDDGQKRVFSHDGDDISGAFPDIIAAMDFRGVLDGTLVAMKDGAPGGFEILQPRLGRARVSARMLADRPAHVRLHDMLLEGEEDIRPLPFDARQARLEAWYGGDPRPRLDLSPLIAFADWQALADQRDRGRQAGTKGLMLKRGDSAYASGRAGEAWLKWKRAALTIEAVLMYAQRGAGKHGSFYTGCTFGCWRQDDGNDVLVPVGKADAGVGEDELAALDQWVRKHTVKRYGPVREVSPGLVLEVAFERVYGSKRHKSGLAMRSPRISRIRWDKPAEEAGRLDSLAALGAI